MFKKILLSQQMESLENQIINMEKDYVQIQTDERALVQKLNEKYGPGSLDPSTGNIYTNRTT